MGGSYVLIIEEVAENVRGKQPRSCYYESEKWAKCLIISPSPFPNFLPITIFHTFTTFYYDISTCFYPVFFLLYLPQTLSFLGFQSILLC